MSKLPAFQFYPGDWRKDPGVQSLSFHDRGVWFELICLMHESESRGKLMLNGLPMPEDAISRLLGLDNQILTTTLTTLLTYGVASKCEKTGAIMSRRMVRDEEIRQVRKSCGKMGGNPNLVNQKTTTVVNQISTPSSSSSSSVSFIKEESPESSGLVPPLVNQKKKKEFADESIEMEAAKFFWSYLKDWAPSAKEPNNAKFQSWAKDFDMIMRVDKRTASEINELLDWINTQKESKNGFSWRKNIQSPGTLRTKWNEGRFADFLPSTLSKDEYK